MLVRNIHLLLYISIVVVIWCAVMCPKLVSHHHIVLAGFFFLLILHKNSFASNTFNTLIWLGLKINYVKKENNPTFEAVFKLVLFCFMLLSKLINHFRFILIPFSLANIIRRWKKWKLNETTFRFFLWLKNSCTTPGLMRIIESLVMLLLLSLLLLLILPTTLFLYLRMDVCIFLQLSCCHSWCSYHPNLLVVTSAKEVGCNWDCVFFWFSFILINIFWHLIHQRIKWRDKYISFNGYLHFRHNYFVFSHQFYSGLKDATIHKSKFANIFSFIC